ncbi:MAG: hypothetical protein ACR2GH_21215, partial [Pseudonocardia sp.]
VRRQVVTTGLLLALLGPAGACSSTADPGPVFNNEGGIEVTCMVHQTEGPGARYTDEQMRDTAEVLTLMRYYTANGAKPFCDGAPATAADTAWAQLYVDFGGSTEKVSSVLG